MSSLQDITAVLAAGGRKLRSDDGAAHVPSSRGEGGAANVPEVGGELPPLTNRGVTVAWMGVHWFAGTTRGLAHNAVLDVLHEHLSLPVTDRPRGGYGYGSSAGVGSASVYWSVGRTDVFVVLPGEVCEELGVPGLVALATELDLEPTSRLDVAWDVSGVPVAEVQSAWSSGNVVTRAHRDSWKHERNSQGETFYMGSRASGRMVRVYDRRGPTRFEMEWKGERSLALWRRLMATAEEGWSCTAMSELRAFLDFRDRSEGIRPDFCPLLPWWAAVTDDAARWCVTIPRAAKTLEQKREWLRSQVAPVLAMVADGVQDWTAELGVLLDEGRARYARRSDRVALVQQAQGGWLNAAD